MATLDLDNNQAKFQIRAYKPGWIQVNDQQLTNSLIITPEELITNWQPSSISDLTTESFAPIIKLKPDIFLIGTGSKLVLLPLDLYGSLINLGIGVEIMDTRAACHTFNALAAENRRVAAGLIIR